MLFWISWQEQESLCTTQLRYRTCYHKILRFFKKKYFVEKLLTILLKLKSSSIKPSFDNTISSHLQHHMLASVSLVFLLHPFVQQGCPFAVVSYIPAEVGKWHGFDHQSRMPPLLWNILQHHSAAWPRVKFLCLSQWKPLKK